MTFSLISFVAVLALSFSTTHTALAAEEEPAEGRTIKVHCDAPATNYTITIESVWRVGDALWVVSKIEKQGDMGGAMISSISDEVTVDAGDDLEVKHFISGKTWNWWEGVECTFIDSRAALLEQMKKDKVEIDAVLHGDDPA